jgi:hypothetical protein
MPEAQWLLSDFCEPPAGLGKWRARLAGEEKTFRAKPEGNPLPKT